MNKNITSIRIVWNFILFFGFCVPTIKAQSLLDPRTQTQFVNPLPVPSVIDGRSGGTFTINISQFNQWLGLIDPTTQQHLNTTVWGYNGSYPGPTIVAKKDVPISVFWHNNLVNSSNQPLPHLLPIDRSIDWAFGNDPAWQTYGVPIVTHVHGGHTESASDGLPDNWYTPNFARKGPGFIKGDIEPYYYSNDQEAATIWYHDHALGVTRLNVYAGLAGYYIITDNNEINLQTTGKLPVAPYDMGLAIQDRMFTSTGQLFYPSTNEEEEAPEPSILPEVFGDFILVNGMTWPVLQVEPRQYRFRVLNGSDSRFYNLFLSSGQQIIQIGSDQGFLYSPFAIDQMLLAPGERKDIILDFSDPALWGQTIILKNNAKTPYPRGATPDPQTTGRIMAFRVNKPLDTNYPLTTLPATLRSPIIPLQTDIVPRKLILYETEDEYGRIMPILGTVNDGMLGFREELTENPSLNSTEIWELYNETMDAHPIHLHLVSMQMINRQKFVARINEENGKPTNIRLVGQPKYPGPDEQGWKDTWVTFPGEVTRVIAKFDRPGLYVWHCHILSHEEHDMMRPFFVGEVNKSIVNNSVEVNKENAEAELQLKVNPNPFSNYVTIQFNLPTTKKISINLYDTKGSLVKKVYEGERPAGLQRFSIDGSNMTNGIYFCDILINEQRILRKLVLQK
ncbi:MAG TPA: multicopper oxidase domain-containing protein [Chitinophagaceae bacterium]|jgi:spore coat protein A|nr:multicopper oxidase domain-containing protein [Chitinophagaceae bacterium]